MNVHAARPPGGPGGHAAPRRNNGTTKLKKASGPFAHEAVSKKIQKPRFTAKRSRDPFAIVSIPDPSPEPDVQPSMKSPEQTSVVPGSSSVHSSSRHAQPDKILTAANQQRAVEQTGGYSEALTAAAPGLRLQANGAISDNNLMSDVAYAPTSAASIPNVDVAMDSVPRSFECAMVLSSDSDDDLAALWPTPRKPKTENSRGMVTQDIRSAPIETKRENMSATTKLERPSTPTRRKPTAFKSKIREARQVIIIGSSDDDEPCPPTNRLTLEQSSSDMPTIERQSSSINEPWTPRPIPLEEQLFGMDTAVDADNESSDEDIPLHILRKRRNSNKNGPSDAETEFLHRHSNKNRLSDAETEFAFVNRPTPTPRPASKLSRKQMTFDSEKFDAFIYSQSDMAPPRGVALPSTEVPPRDEAPDDTAYVAANPAIHRNITRSEQWWKDKAREIRHRPKRKKWFGKAVERLKWLHKKELQEEMRRRPQTRGSAGRSPRRDPQPTGYKRVIDYGDIPEHQLPLDVLNNPAWVKACEWMRATREEDLRMRRAVEYSTRMTWEHYEKMFE